MGRQPLDDGDPATVPTRHPDRVVRMMSPLTRLALILSLVLAAPAAQQAQLDP
jgi:hypothetical protein